MAARTSTPGLSLSRLALASLATVATVACGSKATSGASAAPESQSDAGTLDAADAATLDAAWDSAPLDPTALGVDRRREPEHTDRGDELFSGSYQATLPSHGVSLIRIAQ